VQLCNFRELISLANCDSGKAFCVDGFDHSPGIERTAKNFETAFTKCSAKIDQLHFEPPIGFIAAVAIECFTICKPGEWRFDVDVARTLKDRREHSFGQREDIIRRNE
jgi:hypothetical protein